MSKFCPICKSRYGDELEVCPIDGMRLFKKADEYLGRFLAGRYRLDERIGSGGMAFVYKAIDQLDEKTVAVKLLRPHLSMEAGQRIRFLREVRAARAARHPNIVEIYHVGESVEGDAFMVMEYIEGATIGETVRGRYFMEIPRVLEVMREICLGLLAAHEVGVLHRDIKPDNVILTGNSSSKVGIKLLDFGLAQMKGDLRLTDTGQVFGTPEYLSPEQATGAGASTASDQYSSGVVFFEMLTGRPPFLGPPAQVMMAHLKTTPVRPSIAQIERPVPAEIDPIVLRMLAKRPQERYPDSRHGCGPRRHREAVRGDSLIR